MLIADLGGATLLETKCLALGEMEEVYLYDGKVILDWLVRVAFGDLLELDFLLLEDDRLASSTQTFKVLVFGECVPAKLGESNPP